LRWLLVTSFFDSSAIPLFVYVYEFISFFDLSADFCKRPFTRPFKNYALACDLRFSLRFNRPFGYPFYTPINWRAICCRRSFH
jgi:hypothetical protein